MKSVRSLSLALFLAPAIGFALAGCGVMQGGRADYTVEPVLDGAGKPSGAYKFSTADGKEYRNGRAIAFTTDGKGATAFKVEEGPSKAFEGQATAVKALPLPTTGLSDILAPAK